MSDKLINHHLKRINIVSVFFLSIGTLLTAVGCKSGNANHAISHEERNIDKQDTNRAIDKNRKQNPINRSMKSDTLIISTEHTPNVVLCDMDEDNRMDTVYIVQHKKNHKYGLKIAFGNKKIACLGMGQDVLGQGFDDIDWVGIFEKAPKGGVYYNNVSDDGEIITEKQVNENDKIKLSNDGIFIHQAEACGGGIIYLHDGQFAWIQQE